MWPSWWLLDLNLSKLRDGREKESKDDQDFSCSIHGLTYTRKANVTKKFPIKSLQIITHETMYVIFMNSTILNRFRINCTSIWFLSRSSLNLNFHFSKIQAQCSAYQEKMLSPFLSHPNLPFFFFLSISMNV